MQNMLREFNDYLKLHREFTLTKRFWTQYPEGGVSKEMASKLSKEYEIVIRCREKSINEFEMELKKISDEAIFYIQHIYASFKKQSGYFLNSQYNRLKELYYQIADIDSMKKKSLAIEVKVDSECKELTENELTPNHHEIIKQYLELQKHYIEKVIHEYENIKGQSENKLSNHIGFKYKDKK